jgi:hypothetical protein
MKYLFTGTGRCGTAYLARLLTAAGFPTTHELLFQPFRALQDWEPEAVNSEASWVALCWQDHWPDNVFYVVRDPRAVWSSFRSIEFFTNASETRPYYHQIMKQVLPSDATFDAETWILHVHSLLRDHPKIFIDDPDILGQLSLFIQGLDLSATAPPTNQRSNFHIEAPGSIKKLAKDLGYE